MSKVLEKSLGGFLSSILGPGSSLLSAADGSDSCFGVSLGLINFVERLQAARKISKQEEEDIVTDEYQEWLRHASHQKAKNEIISDYLCRSLIAFSRGHYHTNLHINAIKLTQSEKLLHKKIGYLYISRTMAPGSDLTVLLVNTVQRDLSSHHVLQISLGLSLLPIIMSVDVSPLVSNSLVSCLNHQQAYIRRRAAIMAQTLILRNYDDHSSCELLIPYLMKLLSDSEPSVAIAAAMTLSNIFKDSDNPNLSTIFKDEVLKACAHILLQATKGNLPQHYNVRPINAPFVQVQMLRAIRNLAVDNSEVPTEVFSALESVLLQPWGGRNLSLYMTLLEAMTTVVSLPRNETLILQSLKIVLGFLKSSSIDFKYLGIKAVESVFSTLGDTLTEAHLNAVLECLNSSSQLLQSRTIKLLCSMANNTNYQPICVTLMEFADKSNKSTTQDLVFNHVSNIIQRVDADIPWTIVFLTPLLKLTDVKVYVLDAVKKTISKGIANVKTEEEKEVLVSFCNKLFDILLQGENISLQKFIIVAYILNRLFTFKPERMNIKTVEFFIDKAKTIKCKEADWALIVECLLNCGMLLPTCHEKVRSVLFKYVSDNDIHLCLKSREKLLLLNNSTLTQKLNSKMNYIKNGLLKPDISLSFCDEWSNASMGIGSQVYKPFTIKTRSFAKSMNRKAASFNPFDAKVETLNKSVDNDCLSTAGSGISSQHSLSIVPSQHSSSIVSSQHSSSNVSSSQYSLSTVATGSSSPRDRNVWTATGRAKESTTESDSSEIESQGAACVEIADEAEENSISENNVTAPGLLESQKIDLAQALWKGLGFSK